MTDNHSRRAQGGVAGRFDAVDAEGVLIELARAGRTATLSQR